MIWMMLKTTGLDHSLELCFLWYNLLFHPCLMLMHTQQLHHGRIILFPAWNHAEEIVWYSIYTAVFQGHGKRLFLTKWKCICKSFLSNISEKPKYFYIIKYQYHAFKFNSFLPFSCLLQSILWVLHWHYL